MSTGTGASSFLDAPRPTHHQLASLHDLLPMSAGQSNSPPAVWDEQEALTFTQNFTNLAYNVTAVPQQDQYGYGPAYLLNGLSSNGNWYQVGLSWDWPYSGGGYDPGFNLAYEVFNSSGTSVDPSGGGGLSNYSGAVKMGDIVLLSLYFHTGSVIMYSYDWSTGAFANQTYSAEGAASFQGLTSGTLGANGFFTGLMTEKYYVNQYAGTQQLATYSDPGFALSSAWMWMDEWDPSNSSMFFDASTNSPVSYSNPTQMQSFSYEGATESSDAYVFTTGTPVQVPITLSYAVQPSGSGYSVPTLTYYYNGLQRVVALSTNPTVYNVDNETSWSVTSVLGGSTSSERWVTNQTTGGAAIASEQMTFAYYQQYYVAFDYNVLGGGTGYLPPEVNYTSFGALETTKVGTPVWVDSNSMAEYPEFLTGSSSSYRWQAVASSIPVSSANESMTYDYQFNLIVASQFGSTNGAGWYDAGTSATINTSSVASCGSDCREVLAEWNGSGNGSYSGGNAVSQVLMNGPIVESASWQREYYVNITSYPSGASLTITSGQWVSSGSTISISALGGAGWQFEGWEGSGAGSYSGRSNSTVLMINSPVNETAKFYLGVVITDGAGGSITYVDGAVSGSIGSGSSLTVYVPVGSTLTLSESASLFYQREGWQGVVNSGNGSITLVPTQPLAVQSTFGYNYFEILAIEGACGVILLAVVYGMLLKRRS